MVVPMPPVAEQRRIVIRVNELMGLCDQLQTLLRTCQNQSRSLLEAVLHHAIVTPEKPVNAAKSA